MADIFANIYTIDAYADFIWGGTTYTNMALTSYAVSYPLNNIPTAQIRPAVGQPILNDLAGKVGRNSMTSVSTNVDTGPIQIYMIVRSGTSSDAKTYKIFDGFISGISFSQAMNGASASVGMVINCIHKIGMLTTLAPTSRAFMNPSSCMTGVDSHAKYINKTGIAVGKETIAEKLGISIGANCMEGIKNALVLLYMAENNMVQAGQGAGVAPAGDAAAQETARWSMLTVQQEAIDLLKTIDTTGMEFGPELLQTDGVLATLKIFESMAGSWQNNSGWQLLLGFIDRLWGNLVITCDTIKIIPNISCLKGSFNSASAGLIRPGDIFGMTRNRVVDPVPIKGVNLLNTYLQDDATRSNVSYVGQTYYTYPTPPTEKGMYMFITPPNWINIYRALGMYNTLEVGTFKPTVRSAENPTSNNRYSGKKIQAGVEGDESTWMAKIAQSEYAAYKWNRDTISVELDWTRFMLLAPGQLIFIERPSDQVGNTANQLYTEDFVGQIRSMNIKSTPGNMSLEVVIGSVRTSVENEEYGTDSHPLYKNFSLSDLASVSLFTLQ